MIKTAITSNDIYHNPTDVHHLQSVKEPEIVFRGIHKVMDFPFLRSYWTQSIEKCND